MIEFSTFQAVSFAVGASIFVFLISKLIRYWFRRIKNALK